jgi:hypothetical protein
LLLLQFELERFLAGVRPRAPIAFRRLLACRRLPVVQRLRRLSAVKNRLGHCQRHSGAGLDQEKLFLYAHAACRHGR